MLRNTLIIVTLALQPLCMYAQHIHRSAAMPHVIVYKTKGNYRDLVPVILSVDRKKIASFPGPGDVKTAGELALPVALHQHYYLDRRGISLCTAFLRYTYKQYAAMPGTPDPAMLFKQIKVADPLTELYDCGPRNSNNNSADLLNAIIDAGMLNKRCKRLK